MMKTSWGWPRMLTAILAVCGGANSARAEGPDCVVDYSVNGLTNTPDFQTFYGMDVALRKNGRPVVAFYGRATDDSGQESLFVHHCLDRACSPGLTRKLFTSSFVSGRPHLFMQPNGHPVVVNTDHVSVNVFACADEMCNGGMNRSITPPSSGTDMMDAAMRSDGRLVMVYFEQQQKKLNLVTCDDSECSSFVDKTIIEGYAGDVVTPLLALGPDDRPVMTLMGYVLGEPDSMAYELLACDDAECAAPTRTVLANELAFWAAVAVRSDGLPVIHEAFNNPAPVYGTHYQLRYCEDAACSTSHIRSPQDAFSVRTRSVALDADDIPIITVDGLSWGYLRCQDADCTGAERVNFGYIPIPGSVAEVAKSPAGAPSIVLLNYAENKLYAAVCSDDDIHSGGNEATLDLTPVYIEN
jgi:hypothetical protein